MKKCTHCSTELSDNERFCPSCGTKQDGKSCSNCGEALSEQMDFCPNCGQKQTGSPPASNVVSAAVESASNAVNSATNTISQNLQSHDLKKYKWIGGGIALLIAFFTFFGNSGFGKPMEVKPQEMINDYIRDQGTADAKYKGKKIHLTGILIHKSQFRNSHDYALYVERKKVGGKDYHIAISIPAERVTTVNAIKEGDFISVTGECTGIVPQDDPTDISIQMRGDKINE